MKQIPGSPNVARTKRQMTCWGEGSSNVQGGEGGGQSATKKRGTREGQGEVINRGTICELAHYQSLLSANSQSLCYSACSTSLCNCRPAPEESVRFFFAPGPIPFLSPFLRTHTHRHTCHTTRCFSVRPNII